MTLPGFIAEVQHVNSWFRIPESKRTNTLQQHMGIRGDDIAINSFGTRRQQFIESWIPVAISLMYKETDLYNRLKYLANIRDYQSIEDLFGHVLMNVTEAVTGFDWKVDMGYEHQTHQFINYLKKWLKDCLKKPKEEELRTVFLGRADGTIFHGSVGANDAGEDAMTLVQDWEMRRTMDDLTAQVWELTKEGYGGAEIMRSLHINGTDYRRCKALIAKTAEPIYEKQIKQPSERRGFDVVAVAGFKSAYLRRRDLLSPAQREFADVLFNCPSGVDPHDYVMVHLNLSTKKVNRRWYEVKRTLLDSKLDSNRHGRRQRKGPEVNKIKLVRRIVLQRVIADEELNERMYASLAPNHLNVVLHAVADPDLGVKELAKACGVSRTVVATALDKVLRIFPEMHAEATASI